MNTNVSPRDQQIIEAHTAGVPFKDIAEQVFMTMRGVQSVSKRLGLAKRDGRRRDAATITSIVNAYNDGLTFPEIGDQFGINKNQVAGILNRAGALKKRVLGRKQEAPKPKTKNTNRTIHEPKFKKVPFGKNVSKAEFLGINIYQLGPDTCRSPDPKCDSPRDMTFCGQPVYGSLPYCEWCAQVNYRPAEARNRAPRPR